MPRLLILHPPDQGGEDAGLVVLHVTSLAMLLERRGWTVEATDLRDPRLATLATAADLVLVQMLPGSEIEAIIRLRRRLGRPTVFEIVDNFLAISEWARPSHWMRSPLNRQHVLLHAREADAVQAYSAGLAELIAGINPRVIRSVMNSHWKELAWRWIIRHQTFYMAS